MLFFIIFLFVFGGWLIGKMITSFIPNDPYNYENDSKTIINNHVQETHNHLHVSDKEFEKLKSR